MYPDWCLWWFVDGTNGACLFDLRVCYVYVLCFVRFAEEAESHQIGREKAPKNASFATELSLLRTNKNKLRNDELYKNKQRTLP